MKEVRIALTRAARRLTPLFLIAGLIGGLLLCDRLDKRYGLSVDVTAMGMTRLSDGAREALSGLTQENAVEIFVVYRRSTSSALKTQTEELLNRFRAQSEWVTVSFVDPVAEPARVRALGGEAGTREGTVFVAGSSGGPALRIARDDYYYGYKRNDRNVTAFTLESLLTHAISSLADSEKQTVYFLQGSDETEIGYLSLSQKQLTDSGFGVGELNPESEALPDRDVSVLALVDPQLDLSDAAYSALLEWLEDGGKMLVNINYAISMERLPNVEKLLGYFGLRYGEGYFEEAAEESERWRGSAWALVPRLNASHPITEGIAGEGKLILMPYARPVCTPAQPETGFSYVDFLQASERATLVTDAGRARADSFSLGAAMRREAPVGRSETRIVVLGGCNVMANTDMMYYTYNPVLLANCCKWLTDRPIVAPVEAKFAETSMLSIPDAKTTWLLAGTVIIAMPAFVALMGTLVWRKRRRL